MSLLFVILCGMLGILAGYLDKEIEKRSQIRHGLHVLGRAAAFAGIYFGLSQFGNIGWLAIIPAMGVFGLTFRAAFNYFSLRKIGTVGTTAYYDRLAQKAAEYLPMQPAEIQVTFEFLAIVVPFIIAIW